VDVPGPQVADDERVPGIRADVAHPFTQIEADGVVGMRFVALEANERQRADVDGLAAAVGLQHRKDQAQQRGRRAQLGLDDAGGNIGRTQRQRSAVRFSSGAVCRAGDTQLAVTLNAAEESGQNRDPAQITSG
jgi:hypothetical protein